jgi:hypothetical protein
MSEPVPPALLDARRRARRLQMQHGPRFTPTLTVLWGQQWEEALKKDPSGSQLKHLLDDWEERLTPMSA